MTKVQRGSWVEIKKIILTPAERAPQVPEDTKATPYVLCVNGFLEDDANLGDEVTIKTLIGRKLSGQLITMNPGYKHSFGETMPELLSIGIHEEQV